MPKPLSTLVLLVKRAGETVLKLLARVRGGLPCNEPAPRIIETINLDSEPERQQVYVGQADLTLKREFEGLFRSVTSVGRWRRGHRSSPSPAL
jgi:hypothetical protein